MNRIQEERCCPECWGCCRGGASGNWRSGLCSGPMVERGCLSASGGWTQAPGATPPPHTQLLVNGSSWRRKSGKRAERGEQLGKWALCGWGPQSHSLEQELSPESTLIVCVHRTVVTHAPGRHPLCSDALFYANNTASPCLFLPCLSRTPPLLRLQRRERRSTLLHQECPGPYPVDISVLLITVLRCGHT